MKAVIDTNVLVSALWRPGGAPARVIEAVYAGTIEPVVSDDLLAEYRAVLTRRELRLPRDSVNEMLRFFAAFLLPLPPAVSPYPCPHAPDKRVLDAALSGGAEVLVTGNLKHFPSRVPGLSIMSPRHLADLLDTTPRGE
ncbi:putative toxin-antitoxin system toxin component, PIN family [bacterium]|nr:putative toxin-antitoxin system toxin component, PIN family [bacterium]